MTAGLLDALVLELQLKSEQFLSGQKQVDQSFQDLKKGMQQVGGAIDEQTKNIIAALTKLQQAFTKTNKDAEDQSKKTSDSIEKMTKGMREWFVMISGTIGVGAMATWTEHLARADSALGRLSANLGTSPTALSAWGAAVERAGGSAAEAQASISALYEKVFRFTNYGQNNFGREFWIGLSRGGVDASFMNTKDPMEQMFQIGRAVQNVAAREGRPAAYMVGKTAFGLDEGSINTMIEARGNLRRVLAETQNVARTPAETEAAKKLQSTWDAFRQSLDKLVVAISTGLNPLMIKLIDGVTAIVSYLTSRAGATTPAGMQQDLNQSLEDAARNGPRWVPKGSQIPDPKQGFWSRNFGGRRYITDPNYSGPSADAAPSAAPSSYAGSAAGSAYLASMRASFFEELDRDPQLKRDVIKTASMEGGIQSNIEQMINYAQMKGYTSFRQAIHSGFYGPVNAGRLREGLSASDMAEGERALAAVRGGSNMIDFRTDQGMWSDPNGAWYAANPGLARHATIQGAEFFDMRGQGPDWAQGQRLQEQLYNAAKGVNPAAAPSSAGIDAINSSAWINSTDLGAGLSARNSVTSNYNNQSSSMYLNGPITVNTQATDAYGLAYQLRPALERQTNAQVSNGGAQ